MARAYTILHGPGKTQPMQNCTKYVGLAKALLVSHGRSLCFTGTYHPAILAQIP
ncbi:MULTISPECIES: hypothetical protein [unclassified Leptolyngbya]|uniref:hypothetical protein n=1 Tax=unclassified Leptolyngbya TaxID=2650499 RepID=UPI0016861D87|nr:MULTISPECIES: hypothetical protein [unclassified Leptolyngbya]MBD1912973.1 hypothetical protein [Leptolyngbya sp. FACHB-8]MBD2155716.1 hypothetical protein [Leptolyngbya sp. FACHB-16]